VAVLDDPLEPLPSEVLRDRLPQLVADSCAWAVGLSDTPHHVRRHGRTTVSGSTLGDLAAAGRQLGDDDAPLELGDARPGSFADALAALTADGGTWADRYELEVLEPFVLRTCEAVGQRAAAGHPALWQELLEELGDDGSDLVEVARTLEWDTRLRLEAGQLALAALADLPLVEVEAEGLPLSVVRAAEAEALRAAPVAEPEPPADDDLAGAVFLAERALAEAGLPLPVPVVHAPDVLTLLAESGVEPEEVPRLVDRLPLRAETAEEVARLADAGA
jgi:hypothetical protein